MASELFKGSEHAAVYTKFRQSPPSYFIDSIITYLKSKVHGTLKQAVDLGCGTGQSTVVLAPYFENVMGLDVSEAQIESARRNRSLPNVEYSVSDCSVLPFQDSSVQLVASCAALHWFNIPELFAEIRRILVPNGVVALYGYWVPMPQAQNEECNKKIVKLINEDFHEIQLAKYWQEGHKIARNHYRDIDFNFKDSQRLTFVHKTECSLADYVGYLSTMSAYQKCYEEDKEKAEKLLINVEKQLVTFLDQKKPRDEICFPLHTDFFMLMGHN